VRAALDRGAGPRADAKEAELTVRDGAKSARRSPGSIAASTMRVHTTRFVLLLVASAGCTGDSSSFTPGLGEIMAMQQARHTKLWFAGKAQNWELAAYEVDELEEGFADVVHFHPTHKSAPVPLTKAVPIFIDTAMHGLHAVVEAKDAAKFEPAFDALTSSCNGCHQATAFAFNVVIRPAANPFANQDFTPPKK
jgi:hypothetical protein